MAKTWKDEFPQFPAQDMPAIPALGWIDVSWHNDACPSFEVMASGEGDSNYEFARVWIAESDPMEREFPESPRFQVTFENGTENGEFNQCHVGIASDNWQDILAYVETRRALGAEYVALVGYNPFLDCPAIEPETVSANIAEHAEIQKGA